MGLSREVFSDAHQVHLAILQEIRELNNISLSPIHLNVNFNLVCKISRGFHDFTRES